MTLVSVGPTVARMVSPTAASAKVVTNLFIDGVRGGHGRFEQGFGSFSLDGVSGF